MYIKNSKLVFYCRLIGFAVSLYTVAAHFSLYDNAKNELNLTYFTVWSNILALIVYGLLLRTSYLEYKHGDLSLRSRFHSFKGLATLSLIATGIGFHTVILRDPITRLAYLPLAPECLTAHYIMPLLMTADWILFQPKGQLSFFDPIQYCLYPCLYYILVMARVLLRNPVMLQRAGAYPYDILDVDRYGMLVLKNAFVILGLFLAAGCLLVLFDRLPLLLHHKTPAKT